MIKKILFLLLLITPLISFSQSKKDSVNASILYKDINKVDSLKKELINAAYKKDTVKAIVLYLDENLSGGEVVIFNNEVRFIFTYEEVQKINSTYRLVEIMNDVIEKYGTENDFSINIIDGLNNEISIMDDKLQIKDGRLANQDELIRELTDIITLHEDKDSLNVELLSNRCDQIKNLKKENKKLKIFGKIGAVVGIAVIVVLSVVL